MIALNPDLMQRLAGSLLHFVWQGAIVAMVAAIFLRLLSNRPAEWRYGVSVAALFLMLAAPLASFMFYEQMGRTTLVTLRYIGATMQDSAQAAATASWTQWIVLAWLCGVLICSLRLIAGWRLSNSLTRVGTSSAPSTIQHAFEEIQARLAMTRPVRLMVSVRIDTPAAVGWLRPAVLLPVTALTGLNEEQLRAILAHELAHVRRHDFLVNLMQRVVESILFYHPAVWWISARVRSEREHCCDDLAVRISGNSSMYAHALMELERVRTADPDPAVAATGGVLARRIHRLLGYRIHNSDLQSAIAALTFVVVWVLVGAWQTDVTLKAEAVLPAPPPVPEQIALETEVTLPPVAGAVSAIAAIVTAQDPAPPAPAAGNGVVEEVLRGNAGLPEQCTVPLMQVLPFAEVAKAASGTLSLFVSVQIEGGGRLPIFVNGRTPRVRLTKLDNNVCYEMPFSNVVIRIPVPLIYGAEPYIYRVSMEDLPEGYAVKNIMYRADEPGMRMIDVNTQPLRISSRAIYSRGAGSIEVGGEPTLPLAVTLTRTPTPTPSGIRVAGAGDIVVMPQIPALGGDFRAAGHPDNSVSISGRAGTLYNDGTFEFAGVPSGLHSIVLASGPTTAAALVMVRDRNLEGIRLQVVPVMPKSVSPLQPAPTVAAETSTIPLSSLTVRALDEATQQPVTSGYITLAGAGTPVRRYVGASLPRLLISNLLPGEYLLTAEASGYTAKTQTITVGFGETTLDITIARK